MGRRPFGSAPTSSVHQVIEAATSLDNPGGREQRRYRLRDDAKQQARSGARNMEILEDEIAHLRSLKVRGLRARWQSMMGRAPPLHLSRPLLFAMLAYRVQAERLGDLDAESLRFIKAIGDTRTDAEASPLTDAY